MSSRSARSDRRSRRRRRCGRSRNCWTKRSRPWTSAGESGCSRFRCLGCARSRRLLFHRRRPPPPRPASNATEIRPAARRPVTEWNNRLSITLLRVPGSGRCMRAATVCNCRPCAGADLCSRRCPTVPARRSSVEFLEFRPRRSHRVDEEGEVQGSSQPRTEAVFGYPRHELIGRQIEMLVPVPRPGSVMHATATSKHLAPGRQAPAWICMPALRDGSEFPCEISLSAVATESGMMALAAIRDITDRRRDRDERAGP